MGRHGRAMAPRPKGNSNTQLSAPSVTTTLSSPLMVNSSTGPIFETRQPPIPKRIDYLDPNAPLPPEVLSADALHVHRHPVTKRPMINWKFLCQQRRLLEQNWNRGIHFAKELPGHTEGIYCIQFDDNKIISGSRDNTIKIWDLASGLCLRTYSGHSASVLCLQYDESRIVSGSSDTSIIVWDLDIGKVLRRLTGHADSVLSLRFEKDIVVSCSKDRTVKIWKISTGEMIRTLIGHRAAVNAVQFSPESAAPSPFAGSPRVVVSASGDKTIKIWSFETGECLRTLEGHARGIACIQFEDNIIVSGSSDRSIKIWDITRGECVKTLVGHDGLVRTLQFTGGRIISGGYDETLKIWDQETGKLLADMDGRHSHRVFKLQFNDSKIVSCSQDQKIIIWDFAVGVDTTFLM
ncbi:WD40-repeat-containing domain protein [Gamsiella multidivaricata]|uniref:WD40-repeat-containing domain protein n=1 Tax=Gamsiella multidivaricata TaxID=101098 RepID=UPI00221FFE09|nr:WD40-repeat-containing domain protein [Gamsiella multidivaricata]KAI7830223.1 WD40-repeat-containing domain protein [Gamsiella multidivaricata]